MPAYPCKTPSHSCPDYRLASEADYVRWRQAKLAALTDHRSGEVVELRDPYKLTRAEFNALLDQCRVFNWVIYQTTRPSDIANPGVVAAIGKQLGLNRLDNHLCADHQAISTLRDSGDNQLKAGYIPYTNQRLNWHTDGYYNTGDQMIRAFILHCAQDANKGGENTIIDPDILYIQLRDQNPDCLPALFANDAMTIPANNGIRGERSGSVFSFSPTDGSLHLRYTARTRSIGWKQDNALLEALDKLVLMIDKLEFQNHIRLTPGQGIVCNNVLHARSGYTDDRNNPRTLFRARYYDRVNNTGPETITNNTGN